MRNNQDGFLLIEAVAAVLIVSVSLVLITQGLWTNAKAGLNFSRQVKDLLVMEDALAMVGFVNDSRGLIISRDRLSTGNSLSITQKAGGENLDQVALRISPASQKAGHVLAVDTLVYQKPGMTEASYAP